jgi:predicted nicotinamide N-methyase
MKKIRCHAHALLVLLVVYLPEETFSFLLCVRDGVSATARNAVTEELPHHGAVRIGSNEDEYMDVIPRVVPVTDDWNIKIYEKFQPVVEVERYWNSQGRTERALDPFGLMNWPGSVVAVREMLKHKKQIKGAAVLVLGAGPGLEVQGATLLGAKSIVATDYNPDVLKLLRYCIQLNGLENVVQIKEFDMFGRKALPECDILIASDVMYSERLASILCDRIVEARRWQKPARVLVSDSQRFADFVPKIRIELGDDSIVWENRMLSQFTGSGVLIEEDQTYDVNARVLRIGWED